MDGALRACLSELDFPYKRLFLPDPRQLFDRLCHAPLVRREHTPHRHWHYPTAPSGHTLHLVVSCDAYEACDCLADWYTEEARVRSHISGHPSPYAYWQACRLGAAGAAELLEMAQRPIPGGTAPVLRLREALYACCRECAQFKPSLAKAIWHLLLEEAGCRDIGAARCLDPCAGWGDRLLGAMALGAGTYVGVDPNARLHEGYARMRRELPSDTAVALHSCPFELYEDGGGAFDAIFTSPPFGNHEIYWTGDGGSDDQCNVRFAGTQQRWLDDWLLPCTLKMLQLLRPGGVLGLYLNDTGSGPICAPLVAALGARGWRLHGTVACSREGKRPLPLWMWRRPPH
jgi:hypothetical protein